MDMMQKKVQKLAEVTHFTLSQDIESRATEQLSPLATDSDSGGEMSLNQPASR